MDDHAARLTIDLAALRANWLTLDRLSGPAETGAVVKADAYGLGIETAVPALVKAGCRTFFVAHLSEAIRARAVAPNVAIYVLNGFAAGRMQDYVAHRLRPVLGSAGEIAAWRGRPEGAEPAALHVDTAMNRLGLRPDEGMDLVRSTRLADLGIGLTMTHFASAEVPQSADTQAQIARFSALQAVIQAPESPNRAVGASLCNSSGHFIPGVPFFQLTRPGYALYGGNPTPGQRNPMKPVIRLEAPVVQLLHVPEGEAVGYSGRWVARRDSRIATVSCGYADGFPRNAGNGPDHPGGSAIVAGRECPFAGNVSMDLITIDVTDVPESSLRPGDFVTLIGDTLDIDRVGVAGRTIGYEILTNLGKRYRRVTLGD
ncbi:alanine racemase [Rhabdaerophilum sp. SD176]|uniref:alanine racemase n=1 Tax=Rhabdaerophilum sp. SD176 TaxID=2983548 RepID=UPI0024DFA6CA|nr:alanine racemase [Rhabdaerophilum sp. SD176]